MDYLGKVASAIETAAADKRRQQEEHSAFLDRLGAVVWLPDQDRPEFGEGWFLIDGKFWAFSKYANGWQLYPTKSLDAATVKALAARAQG